jgi:hypothetical protein
MNGRLCRLMPAKWVVGCLLLCAVLCAKGEARAQTKASGKKDATPTEAKGQKRAGAQAGKAEQLDANNQRGVDQAADGAARPGEPSAAYRESLRQTVERRRQRRARRQQGAADASQAMGAIVTWPMPPALIIRHTREVHGEIGSLSDGLRR